MAIAPIVFFNLRDPQGNAWPLQGWPLGSAGRGPGPLPRGQYPDGHGHVRALAWPVQGIMDIAVPMLFHGWTLSASVQEGISPEHAAPLNQWEEAQLREAILLVYGGLLGMKGPLDELQRRHEHVLAIRYAWLRTPGILSHTGLLFFDPDSSHAYEVPPPGSGEVGAVYDPISGAVVSGGSGIGGPSGWQPLPFLRSWLLGPGYYIWSDMLVRSVGFSVTGHVDGQPITIQPGRPGAIYWVPGTARADQIIDPNTMEILGNLPPPDLGPFAFSPPWG